MNVTAHNGSLTATWDEPYSGAPEHYSLYVMDLTTDIMAEHSTGLKTSVPGSWTYTTRRMTTVPGHSYRFCVRHVTLKSVERCVEITVVTKTAPATASTETSTAPTSIPVPLPTDPWPLSGTFNPVWPHALWTSNGYSFLTDDAWTSGMLRGEASLNWYEKVSGWAYLIGEGVYCE